jgi:hypothetical protein
VFDGPYAEGGGFGQEYGAPILDVGCCSARVTASNDRHGARWYLYRHRPVSARQSRQAPMKRNRLTPAFAETRHRVRPVLAGRRHLCSTCRF